MEREDAPHIDWCCLTPALTFSWMLGYNEHYMVLDINTVTCTNCQAVFTIERAVGSTSDKLAMSLEIKKGGRVQ